MNNLRNKRKSNYIPWHKACNWNDDDQPPKFQYPVSNGTDAPQDNSWKKDWENLGESFWKNSEYDEARGADKSGGKSQEESGSSEGSYAKNAVAAAAVTATVPPFCPPMGPPICPPMGPPICPPMGPPICPPMGPPNCPPMGPPNCPPIGPPMTPPMGLPMAPPMTPPMAPPMTPPMAPPMAPPMGPPMTPPMGLPMAPPMTPPMAPPMTPPMPPPMAPPMTPPMAPSMTPPMAPPMTPPMPPPMTPPMAPPMTSPMAPPMTSPIGPPMPPANWVKSASALDWVNNARSFEWVSGPTYYPNVIPPPMTLLPPPPPPEEDVCPPNAAERRNQEKKLLIQALNKPVESTVASRMMEKMGWQGGGLGAKEEGRKEPIKVDVIHINHTKGLGHKKEKPPEPKPKKPKQPPPPPKPKKEKPPPPQTDQQTGKSKKKKKKKSNATGEPAIAVKKKELSLDEALDTIQDFVMDVKLFKYTFDKSLGKNDRKLVHGLVEFLREGDTETEFILEDYQLEKIYEITEYNNYVLTTESQGGKSNRQLSMYKEAPEGIYLVTKDDLIEPVVIETPVNKKKAKKPKIVLNEKQLARQKLRQTQKEQLIAQIAQLDQSVTPLQLYTNIHKIHKIRKKLELEALKAKDKPKTHNDNDSITPVTNINTQNDIGISKSNTIQNGQIANNSSITLDSPTLSNINQNSQLKPQDFQSNDNFDEEIEDVLFVSDNSKNEVIDLTEDQETPTIKIPITNNDIDTIIKAQNDNQEQLNALKGLPKLEYFAKALLVYLKDFLKCDTYVNMRFLGDFDDNESDIIKNFACYISRSSDRINDDITYNDYLEQLCDNEEFYVSMREDVNGGLTLQKVDRIAEMEFG